MIVALAGRRIDPEHVDEARFPLNRVEHVKKKLTRFFIQRQVTLVVASAACGADLLALSVAREMSIRYKIILPFPREIFRATSVSDCAGKWNDLFDELIQYNNGHITVLDYQQNDQRAYEKTNEQIIQEVLSAKNSKSTGSGDEIAALVVWDGRAKSENDVTFHFMNEASKKKIRIYQILTL